MKTIASPVIRVLRAWLSNTKSDARMNEAIKWGARYWRNIIDRAKRLLGLERPHVSTRKWSENFSFQFNLSIHTRTRLRRIDYEIKTFENNLFSLFIFLFLLLFWIFVVCVCVFFFKTTSDFKSTKFVTEVITSSLRGKKTTVYTSGRSFSCTNSSGELGLSGAGSVEEKIETLSEACPYGVHCSGIGPWKR